MYPDDASVLINVACLLAKSGDIERSLSLLESAVRKGYGNGKWMERDPDFNSLRDERRFNELLRLTGADER